MIYQYKFDWCQILDLDYCIHRNFRTRFRGHLKIPHIADKQKEAQWPISYGVGLRIKRSSVRIRPWPLRWLLGQGSLLPLSQGEAFTLASISYLAILGKYILAKKKKKKKKKTLNFHMGGGGLNPLCDRQSKKRKKKRSRAAELAGSNLQIKSVASRYLIPKAVDAHMRTWSINRRCRLRLLLKALVGTRSSSTPRRSTPPARFYSHAEKENKEK